jgi:hypothetical protein
MISAVIGLVGRFQFHQVVGYHALVMGTLELQERKTMRPDLLTSVPTRLVKFVRGLTHDVAGYCFNSVMPLGSVVAN